MSHEIYLVTALFVMAMGPLLVTLLKRAPSATNVVDGFVFASIAGIVLFHILPESIAVLGGLSIAIGLAGMFAPSAIENFAHFKRIPTHSAIALALLAVMIHTWLDGVALGAAESMNGGAALSLAIILHRLPVGIALWWIVRPRWGRQGAWFVIGAVAISTVLGFALAPFFERLVTHEVLMGVQTFVAGSLLHVVVHDAIAEAETKSKWGELVGVGLGIALLFAIPLFDPHDHAHATSVSHYGDTFLDLVFESAPALLIGYALAGVLSQMLPQLPIAWMNRGSSPSQAFKGAAVGLPIPVCSCGVVPLYQGMVKSGVSASAAMAFMVATPELGIEALLLSIPLLGTELTLARAVGAMVVAMAAGIIAGSFVKPSEHTPVQEAEEEIPLAEKARRAFRQGFVEVVDDTAPWILLGLAIAGFFGPHVTAVWLTQLPTGVDVVLFGLLGIPVYVCASGSTPLAAAMIFAGASPGAAIAFILSGPATNVTTFGVLSQLHSKRVSILFGAVVFVVSVLIGMGVNAVIPEAVVTSSSLHAHDWSWWQYASVAILTLVFLGSVIRLGPRGFIANLSMGGHVGHDHGHGHGHGHDPCCDHDDDHDHHHDHHHH